MFYDLPKSESVSLNNFEIVRYKHQKVTTVLLISLTFDSVDLQGYTVYVVFVIYLVFPTSSTNIKKNNI